MKDALLILNNIRKKDKNTIAFFIHGSFVTNKTSNRNYKELRVFDGDKFLFSKFELTNTNPDIDIVYVSSNVEESNRIINEEISLFDDYFITINLMSKQEFEEDALSQDPKALKLILLYKILCVVKGTEYIESIRELVQLEENPIDRKLQNDYDFRKDFLRLHAKYDKKKVILDAGLYKEMFPLFYKFIIGELKGGFPKNRYKLVFPKPMDLKAEVNLKEIEITQLK